MSEMLKLKLLLCSDDNQMLRDSLICQTALILKNNLFQDLPENHFSQTIIIITLVLVLVALE